MKKKPDCGTANCVHCEKEFIKNSNAQIICSDCKPIYRKVKQEFEDYICEFCEESFERSKSKRTKVYCSDICRKRALNLKNSLKNRDNLILDNGNYYIICKVCNDREEVDKRKRDFEYCSKCSKTLKHERTKSWLSKNPGIYSKYHKNFKQKLENSPELKEKHKEAERRRYEKRYSDPKYKLDNRMGNMIRTALKGKKGGRSWKSLVDYSLEDLILSIESKFLPGMCWENMHLWHIDHIKPKSKFEYTSYEDKEFKEAWDLDNLRPLWGELNVRKNTKEDFVIPEKYLRDDYSP